MTEHNLGIFDGYTKSRRPVVLMFSERFDLATDAIAFERQIKGWSRTKKEALIRRDWDALREFAESRTPEAIRRSRSADDICGRP